MDMAMSKQYPSGQFCIVMKCELCNTDVDVNWFCKSCIKNLCDNCKLMHAKIPSCCNHEVGSIGEGRKINRNINLLCTDHGEVLQYRCKPCVKDICVKCLNKHPQHELTDLDEEGENIRKEFRALLESKKKQLTELEQGRTEIQKHMAKYQAATDTTEREIESKFDQVVKLKESLMQRITDEKEEAGRKIKEQYKSYEDAETILRQKIEESEDMMSTQDGLYSVHLILRDTQNINAIQIPTLVPLPMPLVVSPTAVVDITQLFGTLQVADDLQDVKEVMKEKKRKRALLGSLTLISSFTYHKPKSSAFGYVRSFFRSDVYDIACTEDGKVWIAADSMPLQLVDHTGNMHKNIDLTPFAVRLAVSPFGNVMTTSRFLEPVDKKIRKVSPDGSVSVFTEVKSCKFILALTFDSELNVVCLVYDNESKYQLTKLDDEGKEMWRRTIGEGQRHKRTVCLSPDGHYHVILGRYICVVDTDGNIIEWKKLPENLGKIEPAIYDSSGYLIVGTEDGRIHVLNTEMELVRTYTLADMIHILSLAVDTLDRLWIGRYDGKVFVAKYVE